MKSTVQKPVAIKYKSKTTTDKKATSPTKKPLTSTLPAQKTPNVPPTTQRVSNPTVTQKPAEPAPRAKSAKRTLTCYLCGREFGTASLPLHEPKCLEVREKFTLTFLSIRSELMKSHEIFLKSYEVTWDFTESLKYFEISRNVKV